MSLAERTGMTIGTIADLLHDLGDISASRVIRIPAPGSANEEDVVRLAQRGHCFCELIDGVLVEKPMGHRESRLAMWLVVEIGMYLRSRPIGVLAGPDAPHRLRTGRIRLPDVAFIPFTAIPADDDRNRPVVEWIPALAVEVLSEGNTDAEMEAKIQDYLAAGVQMIWIADPATRTVRVIRDTRRDETLTDSDDLDGEGVLPGFRCSVQEWMDSP